MSESIKVGAGVIVIKMTPVEAEEYLRGGYKVIIRRRIEIALDHAKKAERAERSRQAEDRLIRSCTARSLAQYMED